MPSARTIGNFAFNGCANLRELILPNAIELGKCFMDDCTSLERLELSTPERMTFDSDICLDRITDTKKIVLVLNKNKSFWGDSSPCVGKDGVRWGGHIWKRIEYVD